MGTALNLLNGKITPGPARCPATAERRNCITDSSINAFTPLDFRENSRISHSSALFFMQYLRQRVENDRGGFFK
jgi:hypothetical protein